MPDPVDVVPGDESPIDVPRGRTTRLRLCRGRSVHVLELEDVLFHFDSAVLMPDDVRGDHATADQARVGGVDAVAAALRFARDNPGKALLVAGHTDTSGGVAYNRTLSALRARNARAFVAGDRGGWATVAVGKHRVEDWKQVLKWVARTRGFDCDPGPVNDQDDDAGRQALARFRARYRDASGRPAGSGPRPARADWAAFFDCYDEELARLLRVTPAELPAARAAVRFLSTPAVGCGEAWPVEAVGIDGHRCEANRRVELLFFDEGEAPALRCHGAEFRPDRCPLYDPDARPRYRAQRIDVTPTPIDRVDVDTDERLFARYYMPVSYVGDDNAAEPELNVFNVTQRDRALSLVDQELASTTDEVRRLRLQILRDRLEAWRRRQDALLARGVLLRDAQQDLLIPLNASLVMPQLAADQRAPLVMILHGMNARGFFPGGGGSDPDRPLTREFRDYEGYLYLQEELARQGIASLSIDLNIVDDFQPREPLPEQLLRVEVALLWLVLLERLGGASVPALTSQTSPIFVKPAGGALTPLPDALEADQLPDELCELRASAARLDLDRVGLLGHSRGGGAVLRLHAFFTPAGETGPRTADVRDRSFCPALVDANVRLAGLAGNPAQSTVKAIVPLEPQGGDDHVVADPATFYLLIGGSHDEDVTPDIVGDFDNTSLRCPRAMLFLHGATHVLFNQVWRGTQGALDKIAASRACGDGMLSTEEHEALLRFHAGGLFKALLDGQPALLRRVTGQDPAPVGRGAQHDWRFPFPLSATPGVRELALDQVAVTVPTGASFERVPTAGMRDENPHGHLAQGPPTLRVRLPAAAFGAAGEKRLRVPIPEGLDLTGFTHFGFRFTKQYDVRDPAARAAEPIDNLTLGLVDASGAVGVSVAGSAAPKPVERAFHASFQSNADTACEDYTQAVFQRVEVPLAQLFPASTTDAQRAAALRRVTAFVVDLVRDPAKTTDDVFLFADFVVSNRVLP